MAVLKGVESVCGTRDRLVVVDEDGRRYVAPLEWDCLAAVQKDGYAGLLLIALRDYVRRQIEGCRGL